MQDEPQESSLEKDISVTIDHEKLSMSIDPSDEELVRVACDRLNKKITFLSQKNTADTEYLSQKKHHLMASYSFAIDAKKKEIALAERDFAEEVLRLNQELTSLLEEEEKDSTWQEALSRYI